MKSLLKMSTYVLCALLITNCQSDDDGGGSPTVSTVGQWLVSALLVESSFDFNNDGSASRNLFEETSCYDGNYIQFFENSDVDIVVDFAYIFVDENNQQDVECQNGFGLTSTWTQNGNTITVANDDEQGDIIGTISGNRLTVTIVDGFEIEVYDAQNDQIQVISEDFTIEFTKM